MSLIANSISGNVVGPSPTLVSVMPYQTNLVPFEDKRGSGGHGGSGGHVGSGSHGGSGGSGSGSGEKAAAAGDDIECVEIGGGRII